MGSSPRPRALVRAAVLVLALGAASGASAQERDRARAGEPRDRLSAALRSGPGRAERAPPELVRVLAELGPTAIPLLYELATGRGLDELVGDSWRAADWCCAPEEIPELCARALGRSPRADVLAHLALVLDAGPAFPERLLVLRLLGEQASADGLALVVRSASELGDLELQRPRARATLRDALSSILRVDPRSFGALEPELGALEPATCEVLVEAIGAAGRSRGMAVLERLLARGRAPESEVFAAMAELEGACPWQLAGRTVAHAGRWLRSQDPLERAVAARLAAAVHCLEAIPELIQLLGDADAMVRRCAQASLERLASAPIGSEAASWEAWHQREEAWREGHWTRLLDVLVSARPGPANEALRELALHPLYRHEAARRISESLVQQPPAVALAACVELERLGSLWALPGLVTALEDAHPQLRAAAWRALRRLTGEECELSAELWRARIDS